MARHVFEVPSEKELHGPLIAIEPSWDGPMLVVSEYGENVIDLKSEARSRFVLPFFPQDKKQDARTIALLELGIDPNHLGAEVAEVHTVVVKLGDTASNRVAMFVTPKEAAITLGLL